MNQLELFVQQEVQPPAVAQVGISLRDYQKQAISDLYHLFSFGKKSALLFAPTGGGKTVIAAKLIADAVHKGRRVLFCCHRKKLVAQTRDTLLKIYGISSSIIWANHKSDYDLPVQIAMIQTLQNRTLPPDIGLVIFDECHSSIYYDISYQIMMKYSGGIFALSPCYFVGLTATPWRTKSKEGFCQFFDCLVRTPDPNDLVKKGYLAPPRLFGYGGLIDFSQLETRDGDFTESSMRKVCNEDFNSEAVKHFLKRCPERKAIAFCSGVDQAYDLAKQFNQVGIITEVVVGSTPDFQREQVYQRFQKGLTQLISSVGCLCEGFDETSVEAVILARPTKSKALLIQMCGRALRKHPGKEDAFLLDFGECFMRVCKPTDRLEISLCPSEKEEFILSKECPYCHSVIPIFAQICPECGHVFEGTKKKELEDGDIPVFGEFFSKEDEKRIRYLRQQMRTKYTKGANPYKVKKLFREKFGYFPSEDWFVGAIFGKGVTNPVNQLLYRDFLFECNPKATEYWVDYMMRLEFGKHGETYHFQGIGAYKARHNTTKGRDWYNVLGVSAHAAWEEVVATYQYHLKPFLECSEEPDEAKILNWAFNKAKLFLGK